MFNKEKLKKKTLDFVMKFTASGDHRPDESTALGADAKKKEISWFLIGIWTFAFYVLYEMLMAVISVFN